MSRNPRGTGTGKKRNDLRAEARTAPPQHRAPERGPNGGGWWPVIGRWAAIAAIWLVLMGGAVVAYFAWDLPDTKGLYTVEKRPSVTLVTQDGAMVATYGDLYAEAVRVAELPPTVVQALLATEDRRFRHHIGVDPLGLARAAWANFRAGRVVQGGSTITQQLAKNVFLTPARDLQRKVQEVLLAFWLEQQFTKDQILEIYLNRVYFGAGAWGIDSAAQRYFAKSAKQLNLAESAMLVGMLKAPSRYSPLSNPERATRRANQVLFNMVDAGVLAEPAARAAMAKPAEVADSREGTRNARYFADWILDGISDVVGRRTDDMIVTTTLDMRLQGLAETAVENGLAREGEKQKVDQAALLALGTDGAVRAMVGGRDWRTSAFNRATQARRSPGSAFKPFVFLAALEAGISPDDVFVDGPINVGGYAPKNFDGRYAGSVTFRDAAARSINTVSLQLSERAGRARVIDAARRLGIVSDLLAVPSLPLGTQEVTPLELVGAYAGIAAGGYRVPPYGIVEIRTQKGEVLFRRLAASPDRVVGARVNAELVGLMRGVVETGTGRAARLDRPAAGKTGTSSDYRDAWFVGFTADLVAGVWVGNDNNSPMNRVLGSGLPAQIWRGFMIEAGRGVAPKDLAPPPAQGVAGELESVWQKVLRQFGGGSAPAGPAAPRPQAPQQNYELGRDSDR